MLWLLTSVTTAVLIVIALFVRDIAREPGAAHPAALSAATHSAAGQAAASPAAHSVAASAAARKAKPLPVAAQPQVSDTTSGLSYQLLGTPWHAGCPGTLSTPMFSWTAGENAVAGHVLIGGSSFPWHGNACSGDLQQQFSYTGPADLQATATSLTTALDPAYYSGIQHHTAVTSSSALRVSGHQAWEIKFTVSYDDDAGQGVTWSNEFGAVVVVNRGLGEQPAVFYVSVPDNLGTSAVSTLLGSLQLS